MKRKQIIVPSIGKRIGRLRKERLWTQVELAKLLGISQSRLSAIENGHGTVTAEQFLTILKHFNIPLDFFSAPGESGSADLQNALARLGAPDEGGHRATLPSERLHRFSDVAKEILLSGQYPRLIPRLAAVLVWGGHTTFVTLNKLDSEFKKDNLRNRFLWFLDNTREALTTLSGQGFSARRLAIHRDALALLESFLKAEPGVRPDTGWEDTLELGHVSEQTLVDLKKSRSAISKKWGLVSRLQPIDFKSALLQSHEAN